MTMRSGEPNNEPSSDANARGNETAALTDIYCPKCAYLLFGAQGDRCSECGYNLDGLRSPVSRIPWVQCDQGSWVTRYWQTVWMVTFSNAKFCEEFARPINYKDARRFQFVTVAHVYICLLISSLIAHYGYRPNANVFAPTGVTLYSVFTNAANPLELIYNEGWPFAILMACVAPLLLALTGIPSYFFHPTAISLHRQNAGIALSYYLCAPLAITSVALASLIPPIRLSKFPDEYGELSLFAISISLGVAMLLWWVTLVRSARRIMPQLPKRAATIAIGVPMLWIVSAILIVGALPLSVLFVVLVFGSLS